MQDLTRFIICITHWYIPVSYTHLDVYKRQAFLDACFLNHSAFPNMTHERIGMFIAPLAIFAYRFLYPEARLTAVSYTHLDVYKRQSREVSTQFGIRTIRLQAVKLAFCHPTSGKRVCYELTDKLAL